MKIKLHQLKWRTIKGLGDDQAGSFLALNIVKDVRIAAWKCFLFFCIFDKLVFIDIFSLRHLNVANLRCNNLLVMLSSKWNIVNGCFANYMGIISSLWKTNSMMNARILMYMRISSKADITMKKTSIITAYNSSLLSSHLLALILLILLLLSFHHYHEAPNPYPNP